MSKIKDKRDYVESEWVGMPEFVQKKKEDCYSKITVRFRNDDDLQEFAKLIGQKLTNKTKSIWHPFKSHYSDEFNYYIDEVDDNKKQ